MPLDFPSSASTGTIYTGTNGILYTFDGVKWLGSSLQGSIIPSANLTYDLGSTSSQWRSLYVGTSTLYLGGNALTVVNGNLSLNSSPIIGVSATTSTLVNGTSTLQLLVGGGQPYILFPTANGTQMQIQGNEITAIDTATLVLSGGGAGIGNVHITTYSPSPNTWVFGNNSILTLPNNVVLKDNALGSIGLGYNAGQNNQNGPNIAIGTTAGENNQSAGSIAIGFRAGRNNQGTGSVAIGITAAPTNQGAYAVSVGMNAGYTNQSTSSVAIGYNSGYDYQGLQSVAIGNLAGYTNQGQRAVAVGSLAGSNNQGQYAVALGNFAGGSDQPANSIVINASGTQLNGSTAGLFVNPVRPDSSTSATNYILYYNPSTKEITTSSSEIIKSSTISGLTLAANYNAQIIADYGVSNRTWTFYSSGELTIPNAITHNTNSNIVNLASGENSITIRSDASDVNIIADYATNGSAAWIFKRDLGLRFPDGTTSTGKSIFVPYATSSSFKITTQTQPMPFSDNYTFEVKADTIILPNGNGNIQSGPNGGLWSLDSTNKALSFPNYSDIVYGDGTNFLSTGSLQVKIDYGGDFQVFLSSSVKNWTFGNAGTITFPDSTVQSTAWTGAAAKVQSTPPSSPVTGQLYYDTDDGRTYIYTGAAWIDSNPAGAAGVTSITAGTNTFISTSTGAVTIWTTATSGGNTLEETFETKTAVTGTTTHDCTTNRLFYVSTLAGNFTPNFTNLGLASGEATSVSIVVIQTSTARSISGVQIASTTSGVSLVWQGSSTAPSGNASRTDVFTFSILCTSTNSYTVLGMLSSFGGA